MTEEVFKMRLLILLSILLSGCGIADQMTCAKGDLQLLCHAIVGKPFEAKPPEVLRSDIDELLALISELDTKINDLNNTVSYDISVINQTIQGLLVRLVELEMNQGVIEVVTLCSPSNGFDEVLLRLSDGSLVAYFESGHSSASNRFLTVLKPNTYQTTDGRNCVFGVNEHNEVSY